jgi:nitrous oxide reductase accessory protein NosL
VASLEATDFATGRRLDAHRAVYVDGSDFEHCSAPKSEPISPGCCAEMRYDRCLPSLIAFATRESALDFMKEHGGALRGFEDLRFGADGGEGRER